MKNLDLPRHIHAKKPGRLMREVRRTLDLSLPVLSADIGIPTLRLALLERGTVAPTATEWFAFCRGTFIDVDTYSYGYAKRWHMLRLRQEIDAGSFPYAVTESLSRAIQRHCETHRKRTAEVFQRDIRTLYQEVGTHRKTTGLPDLSSPQRSQAVQSEKDALEPKPGLRTADPKDQSPGGVDESNSREAQTRPGAVD